MIFTSPKLSINHANISVNLHEIFTINGLRLIHEVWGKEPTRRYLCVCLCVCGGGGDRHSPNSNTKL